MDTKSTHILLFSTAYLPYIGGAELALKEVTKRMSGFEFDLITSRLSDSLPAYEKIGNVNVFRVGGAGDLFLPKLFFPLFAFLKAQQLNNKTKYDIIFGLQASQGSGAAWLFKIFHKKASFILNIQEGKDLKGQGLIINFFRNLILKKADIITVISNYLAGYASNINKKAKIYVIPNGADTKRFLNRNLPAMSHEKQIITISRLVPKNGVEDLIDAFKILDSKGQAANVRLLIVGWGPLEQSLKSKVKKLNLEDKVEMLGEVLPDDLPNYLAKADIFVRPSLSEGLGIAFLEAMAAGIPIIGTAVGGIPDFLIDGETGLFCKVNDPEDLADKINMILNNEMLKQRLIENAKKLVEERYSWDKIAKEYEKIFNSLNIQS